MTADEKKSLFIIKRIDGAMVAGAVLWFTSNFFLYFLGSLFTHTWFMPRYFLFLLLINIIGGAAIALGIFLNESET